MQLSKYYLMFNKKSCNQKTDDVGYSGGDNRSVGCRYGNCRNNH